MSNKKNNDKTQPDSAHSSHEISELDRLRQIVFGDAQQQLIKQLATLRSDMEQALNAQDKKFSLRLDKMQEDITHQLDELDKRIHFVDKMHEDIESTIQKEHASLASEHEMFAAATQQDFKSIEQTLDNESTSLSSTFNEQLEQLKNHLEEVSKELSSSKTDRKTLAKLLATMATNLEDDQL
ncbi:hypothetical protein L3081_08055 [Colwellia sp. MSW7]|uniref:Uncharacterized protein n=1 Tax=Colwellia maritima TaxID=2912588 RepID=A0ABS9WZK6_9GAMM|nr:hypothetical protein [Colwellia maritima]MCI2283360.1 hypothetical protein [Colwellia maritima]